MCYELTTQVCEYIVLPLFVNLSATCLWLHVHKMEHRCEICESIITAWMCVHNFADLCILQVAIISLKNTCVHAGVSFVQCLLSLPICVSLFPIASTAIMQWLCVAFRSCPIGQYGGKVVMQLGVTCSLSRLFTVPIQFKQKPLECLSLIPSRYRAKRNCP